MKRDKRDFLKPYKSTWNNGKTKTIRIPVSLEKEIMDYARCIDNGDISYRDMKEIFEYLMSIKEKLENKEKGYSRNNSGKLIKDLLDLL